MADTPKNGNKRKAQSIPPELAERMRQRRPGYAQIYDLFQQYKDLSVDERAKIDEEEVAKSYVTPMFQALGWEVWTPTSSAKDKRIKSDLELAYRELRIPVEVKKFEDEKGGYPIRGKTAQQHNMRNLFINGRRK